jgi:hypothetical protein
MESQKKYLPSLALSLFLMLTQGTVVSVVATQKIDTFVNTKTNKQVNLIDQNTISSFSAEQLVSESIVLALQPNNFHDSASTSRLFEKAIETAQKIPTYSNKINTLSNIAVKLAKSGNKQKSLQIFDQVIQLVQKPNKDFSEYEQEEALRDTSIKLAQAGFIDQALDFGKKIPSNLIKAQVFNEISLILTENGQRTQAQQVLEQALQYTRLITGNYYYESNGSCANYKHEILAKIAANLSLQAQLNKALQIAQTISGCSSASGDSTQDYQAWAFLGILNNLRQLEPIKQTWYASQKITSPQEKAIVWSKIAVKMAELGETSLSLSIGKKLATDIPAPTTINSGFDIGTFFVREQSLAEIGIKLAQKQQFDGAMEIAQTLIGKKESLPEFLRDYFSYPTSKISVISEIGKQMVATKKLPDALQLIKKIPDKNTKIFVQIAVASELEKSGQQAQAKQIFKTLSLPPVPTKASSNEDNQIFHDIAIALVAAKQTEKVMQMVNLIQKDKESILTDIALQLADSGEIPSALNLLKNLQSEGYKNSVNTKIAVKLIEQGQLEQALQMLNSQSEVDPSLISQIAEKFASVGKKEEAIKIAESIKNHEDKAKTLAAIALLLR